MSGSGTATLAAGSASGPAGRRPRLWRWEGVVTVLQVVGLVLVFFGSAFLVVAVLAWIRSRGDDRRPPRHRR